MKKGTKIIIALVIVSLLILGCILGYLILINDDENVGYTGFEKSDEAFDLVNNETNNIFLMNIDCKAPTSNGYFGKVGYHFYDIYENTENNSVYLALQFDVIYDIEKESPEIREYSINKGYLNLTNRFNDSTFHFIDRNIDYIDTNEAFEIASKDNLLNEVFNEYHIKNHLYAMTRLEPDCIWHLYWDNNLGEFSGKSSAGDFYMDAISGEIYSVDIQYGDKDSIAY